MRWLAPLSVLVVAGAGYGQGLPQQPPALPAYEPGPYLLQALVSLAVVVGLIYGAYYLLRRLQGPALRLTGEGPMQVVQSVPLAGGNVLHLVQVEGRTLLVASGPQGVTLVDKGDEAAEEGEA